MSSPFRTEACALIVLAGLKVMDVFDGVFFILLFWNE